MVSYIHQVQCVPAVLTCRDVSQSYSLLSDEPRLQAKQQQLAAKEYSAGVIAFYWAVNKRCEQLAHHNVFLSGKDTIHNMLTGMQGPLSRAQTHVLCALGLGPCGLQLDKHGTPHVD